MTGCGRWYKVDVTQGNIISEQKVSQLKLGMTKVEVQQLLGKSLIDPDETSNQWKYLYLHQPGYGRLQKKTLKLRFSDEKVSNFQVISE